MKNLLRASARRIKRWLLDDRPPDERAGAPIPFDNSYPWLAENFTRLVGDPLCARRPYYVWGTLQGAALAKVLGVPCISVIEFGVAGGAGLLALERSAELIEGRLGIGIEVYGFDTGNGLPKPQDYRDCPYLFREGAYPMDLDRLRRRLRRAHLTLGLVGETLPSFLESRFASVGFLSIDLDLYSSTRDALKLLKADPERLLPRVFCYFDDIIGWAVGDYSGERLAIAEFNATHDMRKLSPLYGLKYAVPPPHNHAMWVEAFYFADIFDHPLSGTPDQLGRATIIDIEGTVKPGKLPG